MRKRKSYNLKTIEDKICNETECDSNDFGSCLLDKPDIRYNHFKNCYGKKCSYLICYSRSREQMIRAEFEEEFRGVEAREYED